MLEILKLCGFKYTLTWCGLRLLRRYRLSPHKSVGTFEHLELDFLAYKIHPTNVISIT